MKLFEITNKADLRGLGDTWYQLERAAVSISNKIAEGFERGSTTELIQFLYIAKGSAGECRSMLRLPERSGRFDNFKSEILDLINRVTGISKQLNVWIESLKNTEIKGPEFLTEKELDRYEQKKEFDACDVEMQKYRDRLSERLRQREIDGAQGRGEI